jgi:hypothetical protein
MTYIYREREREKREREKTLKYYMVFDELL